MTLNARTKGQTGEREVVHLLNKTIERVLELNSFDPKAMEYARNCIQRNQNQSAVGGKDLVGVFGLAIEVKRCETLSIDAWWQQCLQQAKRENEVPVLLYRKNHQPWRCVTFGSVSLPNGIQTESFRIQMEEDSFVIWFYQWVYYKMSYAKD